MLRRLLGDEAFFNGLRRFYDERKYQKAGTDDVQRAFEVESGRDLARFFDRWIYGTGIPRVRYRTMVSPAGVVVRLTQANDTVFDLPVTVTVVYGDGRTEDVMVPLTEPSVERTIATRGAVREVQVNRDYAALAEFEGE
jgi:aminopeptidase N